MTQHTPHIILGIETSCDETAAAVYHEHKGILSNTLFSQTKLHEQFGGVVPEIASRSQLEKISPIVEQALTQANMTLNDIDAIAVTNRPGLPGSLLVGVCFAKALAWAKNKKIIGVNHLEGHIFSSFIEHQVPFPHLCITASGGHTSLYLVNDFGAFELIGNTLDDAAGEAFDKIAKLLGFAYPGGPIIEKRAALAGNKDYFAYPRPQKNSLDFSFSGLKTAVLYNMIKLGLYDLQSKQITPGHDDLKNQVASSLQCCIADIFANKIKRALKQYPHVKAITFVGGVSCNKFIRNHLAHIASSASKPLFVPSPQYCTDNAAMIALVGCYKAQKGLFDSWTLDIKP